MSELASGRAGRPRGFTGDRVCGRFLSFLSWLLLSDAVVAVVVVVAVLLLVVAAVLSVFVVVIVAPVAVVVAAAVVVVVVAVAVAFVVFVITVYRCVRLWLGFLLLVVVAFFMWVLVSLVALPIVMVLIPSHGSSLQFKSRAQSWH
jgi:hypothetical protein